MIKRIIFCFSIFIFHCSLFAQIPQINTSADILLQLKKLKVLGSVLYIAAHPDDENNSLLPFFAKEKLYRTGYLSLTRGDGGQNLIGSEQGIELGLIRTQELLAARRMDGAEQFFSRAYEFGFSKNANEALRIWDKQKILSDVVWVIRQFQPDIIITRFPQDARAGHGHHWASAILANEAFKAAADPNQFPEQLKYGVQPWQAKRILWNTFNFGGTNTTSNDQFKMETGILNPLLGKSFGEIGGEARSMHKSQGTGSARRRGSIVEYFTTTGGDAPKNDLMDGIIIDWNRINGGAEIENSINKIIASFNFEHPESCVTALVKLYQSIKSLKEDQWRNKKLNEVQSIIEACSGLYAEATTTQQNISQGDNLKMNLLLNNRKNTNIFFKRIQLENFDSSFNASLSTNQNFSFNKNIYVADDKPISQPYWLVYPKTEGTFDVKDQMLIGKAENDPSFQAIYSVNIDGEDFIIKRPVQYKYVDAAKGEMYQPVAVLPKVEMNYVKDNYVSLNGAAVKTEVHLKSNLKDSTVYNINQIYSDKWKNNSSSMNFESSNIENNTTTVFSSQSKETNFEEDISLSSADKKYNNYTKVISYDHIPTITYFPKATTNLVKVEIKVVGKKIGYIIGAGDKVPEALQQLGFDIKFLNEENLNEEYLKQFDAIVVGIRAYNLYEYLSNKNDVLNKYVENGGNLIVQYLKSNQVGLKKIKVGPYPFTINASIRVTEEDAKVNFLLPNHSAFNYPNKITEKDFDGWIQERSTYQAEQTDAHYEALIGMNDTNEKQSNGSLIISKYGKGNFVYLSLVMFRQLPAGVPGAYRLMANLIALPKNK